MLILVDTNVLLRLVEPGHRHHAVASTAIRALRQAGNTLCVVPQVHYEFWVAATRDEAHDARLVAAMLRHGVTHLLTYSLTDFRRFATIQLIDPSALNLP
jgi:predicted nucleic acid-binding protein